MHGPVANDIGDDAIARLAFLSGQSEAHLLRGTMRPDVPIDSDDDRENVQRALLRHGDLVSTGRAAADRSQLSSTVPSASAKTRPTCDAGGAFPWKWSATPMAVC